MEGFGKHVRKLFCCTYMLDFDRSAFDMGSEVMMLYRNVFGARSKFGSVGELEGTYVVFMH